MSFPTGSPLFSSSIAWGLRTLTRQSFQPQRLRNHHHGIKVICNFFMPWPAVATLQQYLPVNSWQWMASAIRSIGLHLSSDASEVIWRAPNYPIAGENFFVQILKSSFLLQAPVLKQTWHALQYSMLSWHTSTNSTSAPADLPLKHRFD